MILSFLNPLPQKIRREKQKVRVPGSQFIPRRGSSDYKCWGVVCDLSTLIIIIYQVMKSS